MALYEFNDDQVKFLNSLLANADIKGVMAPMVIQIANILRSPVKTEKKKEEKKSE